MPERFWTIVVLLNGDNRSIIYFYSRKQYYNEDKCQCDREHKLFTKN